jgi:hypothetical protein
MQQRVCRVVFFASERKLFDRLVEPHSRRVIDAAANFRRKLLLPDGRAGRERHARNRPISPGLLPEPGSDQGRAAAHRALFRS